MNRKKSIYSWRPIKKPVHGKALSYKDYVKNGLERGVINKEDLGTFYITK